MYEWLRHLHPVLQALLGKTFTWFLTALGAAGVFLTRHVDKKALDIALAFAAGAMIFVVVEEVVPESQRGGHADLATMGVMVGFAVMMILDVAFG